MAGTKNTTDTTPAPTVGLGAKRVPDIYCFGTNAEVKHRNEDSYGVDKKPSHFTQIQPASSGGPDLNHPATPTRSGNIKFSKTSRA